MFSTWYMSCIKLACLLIRHRSTCQSYRSILIHWCSQSKQHKGKSDQHNVTDNSFLDSDRDFLAVTILDLMFFFNYLVNCCWNHLLLNCLIVKPVNKTPNIWSSRLEISSSIYLYSMQTNFNQPNHTDHVWPKKNKIIGKKTDSKKILLMVVIEAASFLLYTCLLLF